MHSVRVTRGSYTGALLFGRSRSSVNASDSVTARSAAAAAFSYLPAVTATSRPPQTYKDPVRARHGRNNTVVEQWTDAPRGGNKQEEPHVDPCPVYARALIALSLRRHTPSSSGIDYRQVLRKSIRGGEIEMVEENREINRAITP